MRNTNLLTNDSIAGQHVGILHHGLVGRRLVRDLEDTTPLGEVTPVLLVLGTPFRQSIETLGRAFAEGAGKWYHTLVHLDARDDATVLKGIQ